MSELASGQRETELLADVASAKAELERRQARGRDRRRDESDRLTQLADHNQRLVEQLSEVSLSARASVCAPGGETKMRPSRFFRSRGLDRPLNEALSQPIHAGRDAGTLPEDGASVPQRGDGRVLFQPKH